MPPSGLVVRPKATTPVARIRSQMAESRAYLVLANRREPLWLGKSTASAPRSFKRNGTPRKGPRGSPAAMARRATSSCSRTMALMAGFRAATAARAASSNSLGLTSPRATQAASSVASRAPRSPIIAIAFPFKAFSGAKVGLRGPVRSRPAAPRSGRFPTAATRALWPEPCLDRARGPWSEGPGGAEAPRCAPDAPERR